jgi:phosphatidylserine/phosphatidylglycerophosphate/cardiolipin synthase-like enzyme
MKEFGLQADAQHVRYFDTCHTKGMVIDRNIAILGSQNLTAAGTGPNRDASLVIWDGRANTYFAELFEYDWQQVAENRIRVEAPTRESIRLIQADLEAPTPAGFRRISLAEYLGET